MRSAVLAGAFAAGSVVIGAPSASANTWCDSSGHAAGGFPTVRCTSLSNGILTHGQREVYPYTYWDTTYYKSGGSTVNVRLGYIKQGVTTYSSYFNISSGQTVKKTWSKFGDHMCYGTTGVLNYSGGTFQTPVTGC
ncbi:hypothetical protein ADK34_19940 [Streptomyces viridochromogenes]|uniref:Secreted protein n=1 Tax=Streptomyces viridochromogenes TaxID=1938 RepID=A0A0L8KCJ6_STRVR|nr:hypothetical protein ADK34_19940 [Streptomyces viridochromogenes]